VKYSFKILLLIAVGFGNILYAEHSKEIDARVQRMIKRHKQIMRFDESINKKMDIFDNRYNSVKWYAKEYKCFMIKDAIKMIDLEVKNRLYSKKKSHKGKLNIKNLKEIKSNLKNMKQKICKDNR
jgi:hypothetical protein